VADDTPTCQAKQDNSRIDSKAKRDTHTLRPTIATPKSVETSARTAGLL
jgi:hypothetical protein